MRTELGSTVNISHRVGGEWVGCSLPKNLWGNHSSCSAQHSCQCNTAKGCFGFCRCLYKISHTQCLSLLFSVWSGCSNYWFSPGSKELVKKKISVGWTNVAEAPQKVHKLFTKLARASILLPQCLKTTCLLSHFIRRLLHSSSTDIAARTFWSYWLACLFCLFSNKKNHMH